MINTTISGNTWIFSPRDVNKALSRSNQEAMRTMANMMIRDTTPFVPKHDGDLRGNVSIVKASRDEIQISWSRPGIPNSNGPQAANLLWHGINPRTKRPVKKWTEKGTGPRWTEEAEKRNRKKWDNLFTYTWMRTFQKSYGTPKNPATP